MPQPRKYASDAERVSAFRERKRRAQQEAERIEREAAAIARAKAREREEVHSRLRQSIGEQLAREARMWHFPNHREELRGITEDDRAELREYAALLADALKRGSIYLPR